VEVLTGPDRYDGARQYLMVRVRQAESAGSSGGEPGGRAMSWLDDLQASDPAYPAPGTGDLWQAPPTADWATLASPPEPEAEL
jgi:hypothetical protein